MSDIAEDPILIRKYGLRILTEMAKILSKHWDKDVKSGAKLRKVHLTIFDAMKMAEGRVFKLKGHELQRSPFFQAVRQHVLNVLMHRLPKRLHTWSSWNSVLCDWPRSGINQKDIDRVFKKAIALSS